MGRMFGGGFQLCFPPLNSTGFAMVNLLLNQLLLLLLQVARLSVLGMTCAACSGAVERCLLALPGVTHAAVALTQNEAEVTYHISSITADQLAAAVEDIGFDCKVITQAGLESCTLGILGMTCSACSASVEKALLAVPGVSKASVDVLTGRAEVWYNPTSTGPRAFLDAVAAAGFVGSLVTSDDSRGSDHKAELQYWSNLLCMALVFAIPVFVLAMVLPMLPGKPQGRSGLLLWEVLSIYLVATMQSISRSCMCSWSGWCIALQQSCRFVVSSVLCCHACRY